MNLKKSILFVFIFLINSCAGSMVTSAIGNAAISEKGFQSSLQDAYIHSVLKAKITKMNLSNFNNINIHVSQRRVLLLGNVSSNHERLKIIESVWSNGDVLNVYNEISINTDYTFLDKAKDVFLETKISSRLLLEPQIMTNNYSLQVMKKKLFIIGISRNIDEKNKLKSVLKEFKDITRIVSFIILKKQPISQNE